MVIIQFLQVLQQLHQQVVELEEVQEVLFNREIVVDPVVEDQDILTPRVQGEQVTPLLLVHLKEKQVEQHLAEWVLLVVTTLAVVVVEH